MILSDQNPVEHDKNEPVKNLVMCKSGKSFLPIEAKAFEGKQFGSFHEFAVNLY